MEGSAAGLKRIQRFRIKRKAGAAVLHEDAGCWQDAAGAEFPIERLDVGNDETVCVRRTHPDRVTFAVGRRPARGLARIDLCCFRINKCRRQVSIEIAADLVRIGDDAVTNIERAFGHFDQTMDMLKAVRLCDATSEKG